MRLETERRIGGWRVGKKKGAPGTEAPFSISIRLTDYPPNRLFREIDFRRRRRPRRLQLEVLPGTLPDHLRRQHLREAPNVRVVAVHRVVVVLARDRDAVLRALELVLERAEILVRFELRIILGDREQPAERRRERGVCLRHLLQVAALDRPRDLGARFGDRGEDRLLLFGVALHRFDEVGDEVGAPLQLHLDLRSCRVHLLVVGLNRVVAAARRGETGDGDQRHRTDPCSRDHVTPFYEIGSVIPRLKPTLQGGENPETALTIASPSPYPSRFTNSAVWATAPR